MRCPIETHENAELLLAYCARELDPETRVVLERHMEVCPACREFQRSQQAVWDALDTWEALPVSPDFDRRLYRRIEEEEARAPWWARFFRPMRPVLLHQGLPLAAAACLLVMAGIILEAPRHTAAPVGPGQSQVEAVQADQVERTLDDMELLQDFNVAVREADKTSSSM